MGKRRRKNKKSRKVKKSRKKISRKKQIFKAPSQSKDSDGNTIIKVSDS